MYTIEILRNKTWHVVDDAKTYADAVKKLNGWKAYINDPNLVITIEPHD